mgnify:CR=1 FL=1
MKTVLVHTRPENELRYKENAYCTVTDETAERLIDGGYADEYDPETKTVIGRPTDPPIETHTPDEVDAELRDSQDEPQADDEVQSEEEAETDV